MDRARMFMKTKKAIRLLVAHSLPSVACQSWKILVGERKMSLKRQDLMRKRIANSAKMEKGVLKRFRAFIH